MTATERLQERARALLRHDLAMPEDTQAVIYDLVDALDRAQAEIADLRVRHEARGVRLAMCKDTVAGLRARLAELTLPRGCE